MKNKLLSLLLSISMVISVISPSIVYADETTEVSTETTTEATTEITTDIDTTEETVIESNTEEVLSDSIDETEDESKLSQSYDIDINVDSLDFSSCELLIATKDSSIFTSDTTVLSEYDGVYLTSYENEEITKNAFTYYYDKADFVEINIDFSVSDNESTDEADLSDINTNEDSISTLNELVEDDVKEAPKNTIALIDTGVNSTDSNIIETVNFIESTNDKADDNGHGTNMYDTIIEENPNAKVISIKALDNKGKGKVSDIYAAIQYAIEKDVDIINLSISAYSTLENSCVKDAIIDATTKGITVVGAAGNNGKDISYFIPGNIDEAIICAGIGEDNKPLSNSNWGATLDYYVYGKSSSYAAARFTGILSKIGMDKILETLNTDKIYTNTFTEINDSNIDDVLNDSCTDDFGHSHDITWVYPSEDLDSDFYTAAAEGTGFPRYINIDYQINYSTHRPMYPSGHWDVPNLDIKPGDYGYDYNNDDDSYNTGTEFNWTVNRWGIEGGTSHDFESAQMNFYKGEAFCNKHENFFPTGAQGSNVYLYYDNEYGETHSDKKRYVRAYVEGSGMSVEQGWQSFALTAYLTRGTTRLPYAFTLNKDWWGAFANPENYNLYRGFDGIKYECHVYCVPKSFTDADAKEAETNTTDYYGARYEVTLDNNGYPKQIQYISSTHQAGWGNNAVTRLPIDEDPSKSYPAINVDVGDDLNVYVAIKETYMPSTSIFKQNNFTSIVKLIPRNKNGNSPADAEVISAADADALLDDINSRNSGYIQLYKSYPKDKASEYLANENMSLKGAEYTIYKSDGTTRATGLDGKVLPVLTTDKNGYARQNNIPVGTYIIKETKPAKGVGLDPNPYTVHVKADFVSASLLGENIDISGIFNPYYYIKLYPDLYTSESSTIPGKGNININNLTPAQINWLANHYITWGIREGRTGAPNISLGYYLWAGGTNRRAFNVDSKGNIINTGMPNCSADLLAHTLYMYDQHSRSNPISHIGYLDKTQTEKEKQTGFFDNIAKYNEFKEGLTSRKTIYPMQIPDVYYIASHYIFNGMCEDTGKNNDPPIATTNRWAVPTISEYRQKGTAYSKNRRRLDVNIKTNGYKNINNSEIYVRDYDFNLYVDMLGWDGNKGVENDNTLFPTVYSIDTPIELTITKTSNKTSYTTDNPNYNFNDGYADEEHTIVNRTTYKVFKKESDAVASLESHNFSKAFGTIQVNINGKTITPLNISDYMDTDSSGNYKDTTFYVVESRAGKNYKLDYEIGPDYGVHPIKVLATDKFKNLELTDPPVTDPLTIKVQKRYLDTESGKTTEKALTGAKFTIRYYAEDITKNYTYTQLQDKEPVKVQEDVEVNSQGNLQVYYDETNYNFPLGYITIEETQAPEGFELDNNDAYIVTQDDNGDDIYTKLPSSKLCYVISSKKADNGLEYTGDGAYLVYDDGTRSDIALKIKYTNNIVFADKEDSADFEITKKNGNTGELLAGIEYKIERLENNEVVETHNFTLDANGYYSSKSEYASHSAENGMWFVSGPQGIDRSTPNDEKGALTMGTYRVTEIDAKGLQKEEPIEFTVTEDNSLYTVYDNHKLGEDKVVNDMEMPTLGTLALVENLVEGETVTDEEYKDIMNHFNDEGYELPEKVQKILPATSNQTITDICKYTNLRYNTKYTLYGRLQVLDKEGNATPFTVKDEEGNDKEVTAIKHFKTDDDYYLSQYDSCGVETVKFEGLDFTNLQDTKFVVYESIYLGELTEEDILAGNYNTKYVDCNNNVVEFPIEHKDPADVNQTVTTPDGVTTATSEDNTKTISSIGEQDIIINDMVTYTNLQPNREYTVKGKLYIRPDDDPIGKTYTDEELEEMAYKDVDGKAVEAESTFTATKSDGSVLVQFKFKGVNLDLKSQSVVVFENCYNKNGVLYFSHAKIDDDQTVHQPKIGTTAKGTNDRNELVYDADSFIDTIHYERLEPNTKYYVRGIAMNKETGEVLKLNNKEVTAEDSFTTGEANGPINTVYGDFDLKFAITKDMHKDIEGKDMVIFETLFTEAGVPVANHNDIGDKGQELTVPTIKTTFTDKKTGTHVAYPDQEVTLIDKVEYSKLIPGNKYVMSGTLMNKSTNKPLLDENGKEIVGSTPFTASETGAGTVDVEFKFNAKILKIEGTSIVAFEKVIPDQKMIPVGYHMDINDLEQTVDIPKVGTKVSKSTFGTKDTIKFTDVISYTNLPTEYTYVAKGWLVDKDGNKLTIDGKEITANKEFTIESKDGTVDVDFPEFSAKTLKGKYVVFEEVYAKINNEEHLVAEHKDLTDTNQTINVNTNLHIAIAKADKDNIKHFLKGAEITIYDQDDNIVKDINGKDCVGVSDENGEVEFTITYDENVKYYAKETKAPSGYNINNDKFEVKPSSEKDDAGIDYIKITILDSAVVIPPSTPKTGEMILITFIIIAILGTAGIIIFKKKKVSKSK